WLPDFALLAVCLCLAPSRYQFGDPATALAGPSRVELSADAALPAATDLASLAETDPVALLEACLRRYRDEAKGYTVGLAEHERLGGKLKAPEVIRCAFCEQPYSVLMHWVEGMDRAERTLYVQGANNGKVLIRPEPLRMGALRLLGKAYADLPVDHPEV